MFGLVGYVILALLLACAGSLFVTAIVEQGLEARRVRRLIKQKEECNDG